MCNFRLAGPRHGPFLQRRKELDILYFVLASDPNFYIDISALKTNYFLDCIAEKNTVFLIYTQSTRLGAQSLFYDGQNFSPMYDKTCPFLYIYSLKKKTFFFIFHGLFFTLNFND